MAWVFIELTREGVGIVLSRGQGMVFYTEKVYQMDKNVRMPKGAGSFLGGAIRC